jgi:hypothetical protein
MRIITTRKILRKLLLISTILMFPLTIYCQKDYQTGYIITNGNDTLHGMIKDRKQPPFGKIYNKIRFRDRGIFSKKFGPDQVNGYTVGDTQYESLWVNTAGRFFREFYSSVPGSGERKFLKVVIKGYLTYYQLEFEDQESGYFDAIDLFKRNNESEMVRSTQGIFGLKKKRLAEYFQDCPDLVIKIENGEFKDPLEVADYYNSLNSIN